MVYDERRKEQARKGESNKTRIGEGRRKRKKRRERETEEYFQNSGIEVEGKTETE
jgi:hypothetical protein